jgi:hypothetical protein
VGAVPSAVPGMFDDDRKFKYGALSDQERIGLDAATR